MEEVRLSVGLGARLLGEEQRCSTTALLPLCLHSQYISVTMIFPT